MAPFPSIVFLYYSNQIVPELCYSGGKKQSHPRMGWPCLTQHLVRFMEDAGAIVNTSGTSRNQSFPGYSVYDPLKAALSSWTRYIAKEPASRKIRVNAVSPGPTHSNFGDGVFDKHPEFIKPPAEQSAFGRIGQPEDLARVIVNLLSDDFG
jgi:NAD(P)-dependent dehydrogenase (short-subunit alcohol dehydrogenase family)